MFDAGTLTFQEFAMREKVPLATIQNAVLEFLCGRDDVVAFGAQAVNAYVKEPRMTQNLDLMSIRAAELAEELREYLCDRFHIAVQVLKVGKGRGYRLFQLKKPSNRHLVDLQTVDSLPPAKRISDVLVIAPEELIARKVIAYYKRRGQPKSGTDWRDLAMLALRFPRLKREAGPVFERLQALNDDPKVLMVWNKFVNQEIKEPSINDEF